jgi:hypothetical protein
VTPHTLSFSVAVDYGPLARTSRGVFAQVNLRTDANSTWDIDARIDSASTYCVFGRQWAQMLGLDWEAGDLLKVSTCRPNTQ